MDTPHRLKRGRLCSWQCFLGSFYFPVVKDRLVKEVSLRKNVLKMMLQGGSPR
jgi:hypothetical protein